MNPQPKPQKQTKERKPWPRKSREAKEAAQRERMNIRFANRFQTDATADFDFPEANDIIKAQGTYTGEMLIADPKTVAKRCSALLEMARGRRCLMMAVDECECLAGSTTVAAHSNSYRHGKGRSRKADDCWSVWACAACHRWLDQGAAPRAEKERAFAAAHERQITHWSSISKDPAEPKRFQDAAKWAISQLGKA